MVGCEDGTILVSVCAARARTRGHSCMRATGVHRHVCLAPHPRRGVVNARFLEIHVCTHSFRDSVCRCKFYVRMCVFLFVCVMRKVWLSFLVDADLGFYAPCILAPTLMCLEAQHCTRIAVARPQRRACIDRMRDVSRALECP
jgi:hypothetical protein